MNIKKILSIVSAAVVALTTIPAQAQSLQSVSSYRKAHAELLAKQQRINEQIKLEETQQYAQDLYGEVEPEIDIYTEGWESGLVNPFKESDVPAMKKLDVRNYCMPVKNNFVTSNYGYRPRFKRVHKGVDLRAAIGDTVRAAFSGRIRLTKYERGGYGFYVIVRHDNIHIHMFVRIPPKYSVSEVMGYLKGKSSLMIFERHANLKYKYGNRHFWCRGYYVDTVGKNAKKIEEYIRNQLKEDLEYDQMTLKEYIDPFTGEPVK